MDNKEFISKIGKAAIEYYPTYKILPSLTIAQAILESAWGKSGLAVDCHNYFGMKWVSGCGCDFKEYNTKEQRSNGTYYTISAKFRKYPSLEAGIKGYYDFLQYPRYKNLKGVTDYKEACNLIRQDGWATSLSYSQNLIKLIEDYKLNEYDKQVLGNAKKGTKKTTKATTLTVVNCSYLNCRNKAGMSGKVVAVFEKNQKLTLVEKTSKEWFKVKGKYKGKTVTGYCSAGYLK